VQTWTSDSQDEAATSLTLFERDRLITSGSHTFQDVVFGRNVAAVDLTGRVCKIVLLRTAGVGIYARDEVQGVLRFHPIVHRTRKLRARRKVIELLRYRGSLHDLPVGERVSDVHRQGIKERFGLVRGLAITPHLRRDFVSQTWHQTARRTRNLIASQARAVKQPIHLVLM
jgi:hypothetical protein